MVWAALILTGLTTPLRAATPAVPEAVRKDPPISAAPPSLAVTAPAPPAPSSPIPDMSLEAPPDHTTTLPIGPAWVKPEAPYRGQTFGSSPSDPGRQDRHLALPGIAVTVPLY